MRTRMSSDSKQMVLCLKVTINTHQGEDEDEVYKYLCNLLYDNDQDISEVREIEEKKD